ncbi:MAG: DUF2066 domain-containing protein [Proteobacteria bacterium]|nr:DUF2066 domain-containing protein [Pseudomonadota bacterium]
MKQAIQSSTARLVIAVFSLLGLVLTAGPAPALQPDEVFVVAPVPVDVTAESALAARSEALRMGQSLGWRQLLARLTLPGDAAELIDFGPEQLGPLIQGFEVLRERTSAVRYLATLSYRFNRDEVRRTLTNAGVAFAETPSRPVLIIPVLTSEGVGVLWEDPNPWREAWQNLPNRDGLLPIVVPHGDLADIRDLSTVQALRGDQERLRAVADRYGARDVVVARAARLFDRSDNLPVLEISMVRGTGTETEETIIDSIKGQNADGLIGLLDAGVTRVVETLSISWKQANLVRPGLESRVSVVVPIDGFARWLSIKKRLQGIGVLRRVELLRLSKREAVMDLWVQGDETQLRNALRQRDLELHEGRTDYVLADRDQLVPPDYLLAPPTTATPAVPSRAVSPAPPVSPAPGAANTGLTNPLLPTAPLTAPASQ